MKKCIYLTEGECEEKLIRALKERPSLVLPGKVKKQAYLKYLLAIREEESLALQQGIRIPHKSVEQIRKEFEEKNGSIYVEP